MMHLNRIRRRWLSLAIAAATLAGISAASAQERFKTPEAAAAALVEAARTSETGPMLGVLGLKGRDIVFSGDEVADAADRERFLSAYQAKHQVDGRRRQGDIARRSE